MNNNQTGYFDEKPGVRSSGRLNGSITIWAGLLMAMFVLVMGYLQNAPIIITTTAAGTLFIQVAGPAMIFMYNQKKTESKIKRDNTNETT